MKTSSDSDTSLMKSDLTILKDIYAIYQFKSNSEVPEWIEGSDFYSFTRTRDEISIVCKQADIKPPDKGIVNKNWKIIKVKGPLSLSLTGIIADISGILGKSKIPVFTISTYDTDYILVKEENLDNAITTLKNNSYNILFER
jgi:hypothetical protein